jgi:hypothetical protein
MNKVIRAIPIILELPFLLAYLAYALFLPETIYYGLGIYFDLWYPILKTFWGFPILFIVILIPFVNTALALMLMIQSIHVTVKYLLGLYDPSTHGFITMVPAATLGLYLLVYYLFPSNYESKFTNHWQLFKDKVRGIYKSQKILREKKVRIGAVHNLIVATGVQMIYVFYFEVYYFIAKQDLVWFWSNSKISFLIWLFGLIFIVRDIHLFGIGISSSRRDLIFLNRLLIVSAIFPILTPIMENESIIPYMIKFIDTHVYLYLAALISIYTSIKLKSQEVKDWCDVK